MTRLFLMKKHAVLPMFCALVLQGILGATYAHATIVQFQTSLGNFEVNLYDDLTPITVENFLGYVDAESYNDSIMHRSVPGFIIQGGGFAYTDSEVVDILNDGTIDNEALYSNIRGTIAMAKFGDDPDSATTQWFINLADNSLILDDQNGGFSVFGEVVGDGMQIVDSVADLQLFPLEGAFSEIPLIGYTADDDTNGVLVDDSHYVLVDAIVVIDGASDTASGLSPVATTEGRDDAIGGGGGGSTGVWFLGALFILLMRRARSSFVYSK